MTYLQQLARDKLVTGLEYEHVHCQASAPSVCEACIQGKLHKTKFACTQRKRATKPLELVHSDVCGRMRNKSLGGAEYFLSFIDDKTHFTWVYCLKRKSEVFQKFREWKVCVEKESGHVLKSLRTDNGGEYTSKQFRDYLLSEGIRHELTIPKTPEQNGVAERMNRTLVETVRSMLFDARLPKRFWAECLSTAVYLRNRSPSKAVVGMTPFEAWNGIKPDVSHLRVFGSVAYAHIEKDERSKLDGKARKCILLGYGSQTKGYRLYDQEKERVTFSRNVVFEESEITECVEPGDRLVEVELGSQEDKENHEENLVEDENAEQNEDNIVVEQSVRRSQRERRRPDYYGAWIHSAKVVDKEPVSVEEALSGPEKQEWRKAMEREVQSMNQSDVWDLVELPNDRRAIGCRWVFKRKIGPEGEIERYKARLVAQGCSQKFGSDYDETFCPVVRFESVRMVIAVAVQYDLQLHQMDFTSAFLNGDLEEEVYMRQPKGFIDSGKEHLVCKLKHSLYGLKQSPRCWNSALDDQLKKMSFKQSNNDPCIYISYALTGEVSFIMGVYVDDVILAGKSKEKMTEIKKALAEKFDLKDLGELKYFLGVNVQMKRECGAIWIGQSLYIESVLKKFGMETAKAISTPVDTGIKLLKATTGNDIADPELYQSAIGSLLYISTKTRPDIAYAVGNVARFCSNPSKEHWVAVKRIFRYLRGTTDLGLLYKKSSPAELIGYSDADWGGDIQDSKSTSGYCFEIGGTLVSWKSSKQGCVALSTAEAEYVALSSAAQEATWLRELCKDVGYKSSGPTIIYEDNQAAIKMAKNSCYHGRTKHISIRYHYIREQVSSNVIELRYCRTDEMKADIFTKGLNTGKFTKLCKMAGISASE
jgi:transposase InsO family protein